MAVGDRPVRVLVVHPRDPAAPSLGGIQTFLHDLIKHAPPDFEITVAGVTSDPARRPIGRRQAVDVAGRRAWTLPLAPEGRLARTPVELARMVVAQLRLRRLMRDRRTILQVHRPYRRLVLAGHRGPRVQFVHLDLRDWPGPSGWSRLRLLYRPFSSRALESMSRVFVVNERGAEELRRSHPSIAERIEFLPVWVDEDAFHPPADGERNALRARLRERLSLTFDDDDERYILFAARLDPVKAPLLAIDAFAELAAEDERARLLIAGDGELRKATEERISEHGLAGRVHLLGSLARDDLALLMRASDVLLLSSRAEGGGPRVVVEALASGLPIVATDVGEIRRTVHHEVNGWLAAEHTPGSLAAGLRWALSRPRGELIASARAAVEPYTARRVLERLYDTYRRLLSDDPAG